MNKKLIISGILLIAAVAVIIFIAGFFSRPDEPEFTWVSSQELFDQGIIPQPGKILEVVLNYDVNAEQKLAIKEISIKNGYAPVIDAPDREYRLKLVNAEGGALRSLFFDVPDEDSHAARKDQPEEVSFVVTLDWIAQAKKLEIVDSRGSVVASKNLEGIPMLDNKPKFEMLEFQESKDPEPFSARIWDLVRNSLFGPPSALAAADGYLDIVFLGDQYPGAKAFVSDIKAYVQTLGSIEPFKSRRSQIRIWHAGIFDGGYCNDFQQGDDFPNCERNRAAQDVNTAGVPYDKIAILLNNNGGNLSSSKYGGMSAPKATCCLEVINWRPQNSLQDSTVTFVHELAHLLSKLADEYQMTASNPIQPDGLSNCYAGTPPNPDWEDLVAPKDYRQRCSKTNWYRPYELSIMDDTYSRSARFNSVSQVILNRDMNVFTGPFRNNNRPTASISSPADGSTVSGVVQVQFSASDDIGVARANLYVNGKLYETSYVNPNFSWDTAGLSDGSYTLEVRAYDVPGNIGSASVRVNIGTGGGGNGDDDSCGVACNTTYNACTGEYCVDQYDACIEGCSGSNNTSTSCSGSLAVLISSGGNQGANSMELAEGTCSIAETLPEGWTAVSASCKYENGTNAGSEGGTDSVTDVTIAGGETTTCTFENEKKSGLVIVKKTTGGDDTFNYYINPTSSQCESAYNACIGNCGNNDSLCVAACANARELCASEQRRTPEVKTASVTTENGEGQSEAVYLGSGSSSNSQCASLRDACLANCATQGNSPTCIQLCNDQYNTCQGEGGASESAETYDITEESSDGWTAVSASCKYENGTNAGFEGGTDSVTGVNVPAGETVICTFENKKESSLVIIKNAFGGDDTFTYYIEPTPETDQCTAELDSCKADCEANAGGSTSCPQLCQSEYDMCVSEQRVFPSVKTTTVTTEDGEGESEPIEFSSDSSSSNQCTDTQRAQGDSSCEESTEPATTYDITEELPGQQCTTQYDACIEDCGEDDLCMAECANEYDACQEELEQTEQIKWKFVSAKCEDENGKEVGEPMKNGKPGVTKVPLGSASTGLASSGSSNQCTAQREACLADCAANAGGSATCPQLCEEQYNACQPSNQSSTSSGGSGKITCTFKNSNTQYQQGPAGGASIKIPIDHSNLK